MSEEKFDAKRDQISGKIKETVGHLTDDRSLEAEGKAEHTKGKLAEVLDDAKEELKRALKAYKGSILMVCHEPDFYDGWVTDVWDFNQLT